MAITDAIKVLEETFLSQVLLPGTVEYTELNSSYLSALENDITPACIFRPTSNQDISTFLKLTNNTHFAIRGGGQQPLPGCANIPDGITLDLGLLTGIELNEDTSTVSIAAGERWGNVYNVLAPKNLAVAGGRSANGGIGGLALQALNPPTHSLTHPSGLSFFSSREGFICDNLTKPDASHDTHLMLSIGYAAPFGGTMCQNQVYFTKAGDGETDVPRVLERFVDITPRLEELSSVKLMDIKEAAGGQAAVAMEDMRSAYMNITLKASSPALETAADIYTSPLDPIKSKEGIICSLTLQPHPVSLLEKSVELGGNSLGLSPEDGPLISVLLLAYWKDREDDEHIMGLMKDTLGRIEADAKEKGQAVGFTFMNYASGFQDPVASYGVENVSRLQGVSRKYDPEGVFQRLVPGGFKLFG
ncbi:FAD-binding domain-containing protein [Aspergillus sclerotioniger CBS 115572]|uniref:FAD-binding domain-containing protein n=1 Tax=Aspergillus sclerotioniger CBS 115572 TaxID=1450535 RepID=A0A317X529_9EURO|nr:FAD-binding domain-containing protein [Aspergillus sclerotioniger CBS 115572]PWY93673.1 FAD-binding domain-containing protein [Aspergillus sclerotioniger CBS 115572]